MNNILIRNTAAHRAEQLLYEDKQSTTAKIYGSGCNNKSRFAGKRAQ